MIVERPELYQEYVKTMVTELAILRGESISEERADAFARSMVAPAYEARAGLVEQYNAILKDGEGSWAVLGVPHRAEALIAKRIIGRAEALVAEEGGDGEVLLRPERHRLGHFSGTLRGDAEGQLAHFWRNAYQRGPSHPELEDPRSIYRRDVNIPNVINGANSMIGRFWQCIEVSCQ